MSADDVIISVDWGTSRLRVRLFDVQRRVVLASVASDDGAATLANASPDATGRAERFRQVLADRVAQLAQQAPAWPAFDRLPIYVSGMASASIGWRELPYAALPFSLTGRDLLTHDLGPLSERHPGRVTLISGVRDACDVMRGEEVEAVGLATAMSLSPEGRYTLVLPGTHSKHLSVVDGAVVAIRTHLTGELFDLLCRYSLLRHSTSPTAQEQPMQAFESGVQEAMTTPLTAALFGIRARHLLHRSPPEANTAFLSGLLIGSELWALKQSTTSHGTIIIAANADATARYLAAARKMDLPTQTPTEADAAIMSQLGHAALHARLCNQHATA